MKKMTGEEFSKKLGDDGLVKIILYKLSCGEKVALTVTGNSMLPFLADGRDKVVLQKIEKLPKKGDIVFYRRKNGAYVLHRVVKRKGELFYFSGDAQLRVEGPVGKGQLLAVCKEVERDGKTIKSNSISWLSYKLRFFKAKRD
ncbi:MAG: S24/S26 family peptidase [Clostridia bacterium]|nr:S24/S26 family peptidase [Clostridia bacterium]